MDHRSKQHILLRIIASLLIIGLSGVWQQNNSVSAQDAANDVLYTNDADFDRGTLVSVNHDAPYNDQLQLDSPTEPFPFINVAASGRGTVVRANTDSGEIVGEYRSAPEGRGLNPSRTTVDLFGNVWTANRDEVGTIDGVPYGSAVKIGLIVGGTRVDETNTPTPDGGYLAPPFSYNTCIDRNGDGLIRTSRGLGDVLDWPDISDGLGGTDGLVEDAVDECILVYQRLQNAEQTRHVSVDADNNVWVGGYPFTLRMFYKLDGATGAILDSFNAQNFGCGGYGGLVDGNGILWSVGGALLRYDPVARIGFCIQQYGYGLGIDTNGYIWMSLWDGGIVKIAPDGTVMPGFPKSTYPPSMLTSTMTTADAASQTAPVLQTVAQVPENRIPSETWMNFRSFSEDVEPASAVIPSATRGWNASDQKGLASARPNGAVALDEEAEDASATFQVAPVDDWVQSSSPWTPGATISLTIEEGGVVVYADSQVVDSYGNFYFNLRDVFDLQRGQVVTVSDGTVTKTHTVASLFVDGANVIGDTVFGRANAGSSVDVWVHGDGGLTATADGSGNWVADFSGQTDLTYLSDGGSRQTDSDGDSTGVWWASPRFQLAPNDNWVQSSGTWTPGATVSLTIEAGGVVVYADSQTVSADGYFNFSLGGIFDLQRGQVVTVSDGTSTKTHTVTNLFVDGVNTVNDTVLGRADAGTNVDVWVHGDGYQTVTADGTGHWVADFSGMTDLTYTNDGGSQQVDSDGDSTGVWWNSPTIRVAPDDDWVRSNRSWVPNTTISLTIEDGGVIVYSDTQTTDDGGNFNFGLRNLFDLRSGQVVTVSDGITTRTHVVVGLFVDTIDVAADTVSGHADAGADVEVWVNNDGTVVATADGLGHWMADFSGLTDLTYSSEGGVRQYDNDGDFTRVRWYTPRFQVAPEDEWVGSWKPWARSSTVTMTIEEGGTVVYADTMMTDADGNFNFNLWDRFDLQRGQLVTISDGTNTKTHTVMALDVDTVNVTDDTVLGRADPNSSVEVWVDWSDANLTTTADASGYWSADFTSQTDLAYFSEGGSQQFDDDGDSTGVWWSSPRIQVAPDDNWVQAWRPWTSGSTIRLTIEDGGAVVYTESQIADGDGYFNFNLWNKFDLQRGQVVTISDGTTTKTHTVMNLDVNGVDVAADTVFGQADAGTEVQIWVHGDGNLFVTADASGQWVADFSDQTDLTYLNDGGSRQFDEDGDSTGVWWSSPRFQAVPEDDWVGSWKPWTPGSTVTMTIEEGGVIVYTAKTTADADGNFNFNLWDVFDLQRGQVVTISDGTITKTHTVMPLYIDGVNVAADVVSGRAEAGTQVDVWVNNDGNLTLTADGTGHWTADFSSMTDLTYLSDGGSQQFDDDGDTTGVWWSSPNFQVAPDDNWVQPWNRWAPGATITLTVEDGGVVVYSGTQTADYHGNFNFNSIGVDLVTGQLVTVSDGTTTKTHTINGVTVTDIDTDADQIHGSAIPGARLWVWANLFNAGSGRWVVADAGGSWMADFTVPMDNQPAYDITGITRINVNELDEDGDSTYRQFGPPIPQNRGVAVTPTDNHVWVASSAYGTVTRLDNDGNILSVITTGDQPTGVAVDAVGKVWATNMGSSNSVRIDPHAGLDGLGAVDLTVDLGKDAWPYNYSDMTGAVVVGSTSPQGFWSVVQDSETPGFEWGRILWNTEPQGSEPAGTAIVVEARAADTEAGLGGETFQLVENGELFSLFGRFIEVRVTLKSSPTGVSPVLSDIRIQPHVIYVDIDIKPGSFPNAINCKDKREIISVAVLTTADFDALTVDHTTVRFEGASEIHVDKRTGLPVRHVEDIDLDGDLDLVFHFYMKSTTLTCTSTSGTLTGLTYDGIPIEGTDSVWMIKR